MQYGHFRGCLQWKMSQQDTNAPPEIMSDITYNDATWRNYTLPQENPQNISIT